jgi:hypothetical protein
MFKDVDASVKTGFQLWIMFTVTLYVLGYEVFFSLILAAIAALAGKFIVSWQTAKDSDTPPQQIKALSQLRKQLGLTGSRKDVPARRRRPRRAQHGLRNSTRNQKRESSNQD